MGKDVFKTGHIHWREEKYRKLAAPEKYEKRSKNIISPMTLQKWSKCFEDMLTEDQPQFKDIKNEYHGTFIQESPIRKTGAEVKEVCKNLKNKRA